MPIIGAKSSISIMSGVELASGALGIIESGISLVARLRAADQRRKELSLLSLSDHQELERMRDTIDLIQADDGLRSPIILSELDIFKAAVGSLVEVLGLIYQPQRNPTHELMHQLAHGPEDAEKIRRSMETVRQSHHRLSLRLQILHFKLTASCKGDTGREEAEGGRGVGDPDMKGKASVSELHEATAGTNHLIVGNISEGDAIQINAPIGDTLEMEASRVEIRNNVARGSSGMINYSISIDAFKYLLEHKNREA